MTQQDVTQPINSKPCDDGGLSLPSRPNLVELKKQCDAVIAFCHHAHKLSVESADRCGVPVELIQQLRLDRTLPPSANPSLITALSYDERQDLLAKTRSALKEVARGHTGSFPDFIGYAQRVAHSYKRLEVQGLDLLAQELPSRNSGDPTSVASSLSTLFSTTNSTSRNKEQKKNTKSLIRALARFTQESMPNVSAEATRSAARTLVDSE